MSISRPGVQRSIDFIFLADPPWEALSWDQGWPGHRAWREPPGLSYKLFRSISPNLTVRCCSSCALDFGDRHYRRVTKGLVVDTLLQFLVVVVERGWWNNIHTHARAHTHDLFSLSKNTNENKTSFTPMNIQLRLSNESKTARARTFECTQPS